MGKTTKATATDKKNKPVELKEFKGENVDGKAFKVSAPEDSLDKHAEEALKGVYRSC